MFPSLNFQHFRSIFWGKNLGIVDGNRWFTVGETDLFIDFNSYNYRIKKKIRGFLIVLGETGNQKKKIGNTVTNQNQLICPRKCFWWIICFFYRNISWIFLGETGNKQQKTLDVLFFLAVKVAELWNFAADFFSFPKDAIIPSVKIY